MLSQELDNYLRRQIRDEAEIESRHRCAGQNGLRAGFSMTGVDTADRAGGAEDMLLDERVTLHRSHPAADTKLAFQTCLVEFDLFQDFGVFVPDRSNVRRETVDGDDAFRRSDGGECLHETPGRIRNDRAPLGMQIRARAKRAQL